MTNFKLGDNIVFNLNSLALLYKYYRSESTSNQNLLRKSIILINASCTEAVLHDFYKRIRGNTKEGVTGLAGNVVDAIRILKRIDKFDLYITHAEKHDFFNANHTDMYEVMHEIRQLRNRVHIQNEKNHFEPDDVNAFNEERLTQSEKVLEAVVRTMSSKYPRSSQFNYVSDFVLPWNEHWGEGEW